MSYSGIYIKENATLDDFKEIVDSCYIGLIGIREREKEMKLLNEELQKSYEESVRLFKESGATCVNGSGSSGRSGVSCSNNSKEYMSMMVHQAYSVANKCPSDWIDIWKEKFKDEPEVLLLFNRNKHDCPKCGYSYTYDVGYRLRECFNCLNTWKDR